MDITEAAKLLGAKGGKVVKEKYGIEYYERIGKMGGSAVAAKRGPEFFSRIGKKGGASLKRQRGVDYYAAIGRKGGETVKAKFGSEYFSRIGGGSGSGRPLSRGGHLTCEQALEIRAARERGESARALAEQYGCSLSHIYTIQYGRVWKNGADA